MTTNEGAAALLLGSLALIVVLAIVFYVLLVIALWKIFKKMGEPGWKSIIPFYNMYVQYQHTWKPTMLWVILALCVISGILTGVGISSDNSTMLITLGQIFELAALILVFMGEYYLYKSFGHGAGWFILSLFFPNIVTLVLGFGSSRYIGNGSEK